MTIAFIGSIVNISILNILNRALSPGYDYYIAADGKWSGRNFTLYYDDVPIRHPPTRKIVLHQILF